MIEYIKSLQWIDYYFFAILEPRRLANLIERKEGSPFLIGWITTAAVVIIGILSFSILGTETPYFYYKITYGWILSFLIMALIIVVNASLIDLFCQFRGHQGKIKSILNLINISFFPHTFLLPLFFIFMVVQFAPVFFYVLSFLALYIWQVMIIILGLSEIHDMEFSESLISFLFPVIFTGLIFFFSSILIVINLTGLIYSI